MKLVIDDETGKEFELRPTNEYAADLLKAHEVTCEHPVQKLRRRTIKGGSLAYYNQCQTCGTTIGGAVSRSLIRNIDTVPDLDPVIAKRWNDAREARIHAVVQKHVRLQKMHSTEWWDRYNAYLKSPEWKARRDLVMRRAGGVCEGCGINRAEQVHHLTYEHVCEEFLWELVAVCLSCHQRAHPDEEDGNPYAEDEARLEANNNEPYDPGETEAMEPENAGVVPEWAQRLKETRQKLQDES